ncbi:MAG: M48 family metalloprotease [Bacteroidales bacterium]|nr:M48 family metalloprotease [Bacteroidales bacterium]
MEFIRKSYIIFILAIIYINPAFSQDFTYDRKIGAEAANEVEQMIGVYPDSALTAYVNLVGQRLVNALGDSPVEFNFHVVDMAEPNAFALPGGYIYVSRGLLCLINDEAELACVMGHEMIHVTKRHSVKQIKKSIIPGILHIPGAVVGMFNSNLGKIINAPVSIGTELFLSNYSHKQESEADKYGVKLAAEAGYDPNKLAIILERLSGDVELLTGEAEKKSYFASHPYTPKRVENIEKEIPGLELSQKQYIAEDKNVLYGHLDGMVYGPNPAQGIFDSNIFRHPDLNLAINFPDKWNTVNVPVAVGAAQPDGEGQFFFIVDNTNATPDSLGKAYAEQLEKKFNILPKENSELDINGFPSWMVSVNDDSGDQPINVLVYWIDVGDVLLNVMGVSYPKHAATIANAIISTRPLTDDEKQNITGLFLRPASILKNENFSSFSTRTNNTWDEKTTLLKNGLEADLPLVEGQVLKIAVKEQYFSF